MRILFVGGLFSPKQQKEVEKNSIAMPNMAANVHQWNIVRGLQENVDIINPLFLGNYPREYKKLFISRKKWSHKKDSYNVSPSTINLFGIKQLYRLITLSREIIKWIKKNSDDAIIVIYSMNTSFLHSLKIAMTLSNVKLPTCLIVPDLPYFYINNKGKNNIYRFLKKVDWKLMLHSLKNIDGFVLLTEQMKNMLRIGDKPYMISEGICSAEKIKTYKNIQEKSFTYTGTLDKEFGIVELVKNFLQCAEADWILNIAGGGNAQREIEKYAEQDTRIHYYGVLTNEEAKILQCKSRVLINPRSSAEEFTKYSFPSKTMEYLKSGRPVLMYHLPGIPKEYDQYLQYFENTTDCAFQKGMVSIMKRSNRELDEIGERGYHFVMDKKNAFIQGKLIMNFLVKLNNYTRKVDEK